LNPLPPNPRTTTSPPAARRPKGHTINPCNSALHPAAEAGIVPEGDELSVQVRARGWGLGARGRAAANPKP
jgi:hypothetical protein